jgi:hypothetical protein
MLIVHVFIFCPVNKTTNYEKCNFNSPVCSGFDGSILF